MQAPPEMQHCHKAIIKDAIRATSSGPLMFHKSVRIWIVSQTVAKHLLKHYFNVFNFFSAVVYREMKSPAALGETIATEFSQHYGLLSASEWCCALELCLIYFKDKT